MGDIHLVFCDVLAIDEVLVLLQADGSFEDNLILGGNIDKIERRRKTGRDEGRSVAVAQGWGTHRKGVWHQIAGVDCASESKVSQACWWDVAHAHICGWSPLIGI